jgi:hypothetical protein
MGKPFEPLETLIRYKKWADNDKDYKELANALAEAIKAIEDNNLVINLDNVKYFMTIDGHSEGLSALSRQHLAIKELCFIVADKDALVLRPTVGGILEKHGLLAKAGRTENLSNEELASLKKARVPKKKHNQFVDVNKKVKTKAHKG